MAGATWCDGVRYSFLARVDSLVKRQWDVQDSPLPPSRFALSLVLSGTVIELGGHPGRSCFKVPWSYWPSLWLFLELRVNPSHFLMLSDL